jgi:hypothetical protein
MTIARGDQGVGRSTGVSNSSSETTSRLPLSLRPFERFGVFRQIRLKIKVPYVPLSVTSFV